MKLTTKLLLAFIGVCALGAAGLYGFAIPKIRGVLNERELHYARSYLDMAADETRTWLLALEEIPILAARPAAPAAVPAVPAEPGSDESLSPVASTPDVSRQRLFERLKQRFAKFYFHETGRLFVINSRGEFVIFSDEIMRGRSISNKFLFEDGGRNTLIQRIVANRAEFVQDYRIHATTEMHELRPKVLFVKAIVGSDYFICITVDEEDLFYTGTIASQSLALTSAIIFLLFFLIFNTFYANLKRRYDTIVENARLIEHGNYEIAIDDHARDEIGTLAKIIDKLAASMRHKEQLERQLHQAQKMELVGTLASGIAHDFNNILAGVISSVELVRDEVGSSRANGTCPDLALLDRSLGIAHDCATRGRDTVAQMLSFSRVSEKHMRDLDLNTVIHNVERICGSSFDKRIVIRTQPFPRQAVARADRSQLEQALLNVCINARDAMPDGGELTMGIELVEHPTPPATVVGAAHRPHYCLSVRDTGCGIDNENLSRLFEPFFTTKKNGSGLGLAMVYKILIEHSGWVDLKSRRGVGTTVMFFLPKAGDALSEDVETLSREMLAALKAKADRAAQERQSAMPPGSIGAALIGGAAKTGKTGKNASVSPAAGAVPSKTGSPAAPAGGPARTDRNPVAPALPAPGSQGMALVVEDELYMCQLVADILKRLGFEALTSGDGGDAVRLFEQHQDRIDLVVLDLLLPTLAGDQVYDRIKAIKPGIKVLLVSGSKRDPRIGDLLARGCDAFLHKPFTLDEMKGALRMLAPSPGK